MVTNNQNNFENVKQIMQENRKLKKYVNCLLKMNDYLKNQLVQKNHYESQRYYDNVENPEMQLMKMEI